MLQMYKKEANLCWHRTSLPAISQIHHEQGRDSLFPDFSKKMWKKQSNCHRM